MNNITILKGNIIHAPTSYEILYHPSSYLIAEGNRTIGIFDRIPTAYAEEPITDYGDSLIIPGLCDLHVHAPQFVYRGLGLDMQLMQWLDTYAFPTEAKFSDISYAKEYYEAFTSTLAKYGTTRAVVFATIHPESTELLMDLFEKYRIAGYIGKVNMDTFSPEHLSETTEGSLADTRKWIERTINKYTLVKPAITPRFIPTCTTELLRGLSELAAEFNLPVQSHISEDYGEMEIVRERYPEFETDGDVYHHFNLLSHQTVMAHLIHPNTSEMDLMRDKQVMIAHCPESNTNLAGGIAPVKRMLIHQINVGLGTDIGGGHSPSILRGMSEALMISKLRWLEDNKSEPFLTLSEVFFMGTRGGGKFFGNVGSFEPEFEFDAVVIDDSSLSIHAKDFTLPERLERVIHCSDDRNIIARYTAGSQME
ncbi:MAG: amidohydrolase family protein [Mobilitalea sp.]